MESMHYQGGIYLKKTDADLRAENVNVLNRENKYFEDDTYEKFFLLNHDEKNRIVLFSPTKKVKDYLKTDIEQINNVEEKYIFLADFLKKSEFVGKKYGIIDNETGKYLTQEGIMYYKYNDRAIVGKPNKQTGEEEIILLKQKKYQIFFAHGVIDAQYIEKSKMYYAIQDQMLKLLEKHNQKRK